jgi:hypothetical protein
MQGRPGRLEHQVFIKGDGVKIVALDQLGQRCIRAQGFVRLKGDA